MDNKRLVANKIKVRLKELGINRQQFAGMMKAPPSSVTKWLSGTHNFTTFTLFEIERILDFPLFNYDIPQKVNQFIDEFI